MINKGKTKQEEKENFTKVGQNEKVGVKLAGMPEQRGTDAIDKSNRRKTENAQQP